MVLLGLGLLFAAAAASARVMDSLPGVPQDWVEVRPAQAEEPVSLRIALRQRDAATLEQVMLDMSTPGHASYGRHLSREGLRAYTAPSDGGLAGVRAWLDRHGIDRYTVDNDWVVFTSTVGAAAALLDAKFAWYRYVPEDDGSKDTPSSSRDLKLRTLQYSVPDELADMVDLVQPTTRFGHLAAHRSTIFEMTALHPATEDKVGGTESKAAVEEGAVANCTNGTVTPACLKSLYNINYTAAADGNLIGFCSYLEEYARYADLESFEEHYAPAAKGQNFSVQSINGGLNDQQATNDSSEANLDVQYIIGVSEPVPVLEYSTGGRGPLVPTADQPDQPGSNEPYLEFLQWILAQNDSALPQTLSTSYGEEEQSVPQEYALKVCNMYMQLGARGVSVIFSSGDSGPGKSCVRNTDNATYFGPTFPAGCPYVTSVGATIGTAPERGVAFSSGGFSIYHERPAYQSAAVEPYLHAIGNTYAPYFNRTGRGIPDVAAQGVHFAVYDKGSVSSVSGTSASAPTFAGVVALLNAARRTKGLAPLGFLNPWLYNNTAALTDITTGAGVGCMGRPEFGASGALWNATTGWDPVTGLGTPQFGLLLEAAAAGVENA